MVKFVQKYMRFWAYLCAHLAFSLSPRPLCCCLPLHQSEVRHKKNLALEHWCRRSVHFGLCHSPETVFPPVYEKQSFKSWGSDTQWLIKTKYIPDKSLAEGLSKTSIYPVLSAKKLVVLLALCQSSLLFPSW